MAELDRQKLAAARLWAAHRYPYLATALFASKVIAVPRIRTIAVDEHWRLYVDPALVQEWTVEQIGSVLVHHTGHLLRDHAARARELGVDKEAAKDWTLAADAEINDDLVETGLQMPGEPVTPQALGCEPGKFAEEYFRRIREREHEREAGDCGSGTDAQERAHDQPASGSDIGKMTAHLLRCQVASEVLNYCRGKEPGTVPGWLRRWAEELLNPTVDWRKLLAAEIREGINFVAGAVDYSYARPSRRQSIAGGVILPSLRKPVPHVAVVCDTSGSMGERELARVLAEVEGILRSVGINRQGLRVLSCDADVHTVQRVTSARQVELVGGGGTNMGVGIEAAMRTRPKPSVVVVLTDGFTLWPAEGPKGAKVVVGQIGYPGLVRSWAGDRREAPSWARVVEIDPDAV